MDTLSLFDSTEKKKEHALLNLNSPIAYHLAPKNSTEYIGQVQLMGEGKVIRRLIEQKKIISCILWGPPGCGKTSLAKLMATNSGAEIAKLNAVTAKIADLKKLIKEAEANHYIGKQTVLFIDEIHRFSKTQQDVLLPVVENGTVALIGATTENPYFSVIPGLTSRCQLFELHPLSEDEGMTLIQRAIDTINPDLTIDEQAKKLLIRYGKGDGRKLLNGIELACIYTQERHIHAEDIEKVLQSYGESQNDDSHYDLISAYIKSMRNSDADAALYWLARLISGGEDPVFIARRIVVFASEDIGNADPQALTLAVSTLTAVKQIGMPEGRISLAQATTYLAAAPKSNACYLAIGKAQRFL